MAYVLKNLISSLSINGGYKKKWENIENIKEDDAGKE